jgi:hypothetical protein
MPEYLRAYIVVFTLSNFVFWLLPKLKITFIDNTEIKQWRNYWILITTLCFFITNIWLYVASVIAILLYANHSKVDRLPLFFAISCASPLYFFTIPGFGVINYLISLSFISLLALFLLWPQVKISKGQFASNFPFYKVVITYVLVISILDMRDNTFTNSLRLFVTYFISILLPFMVISKSIESIDSLKKCLFTLT